MVSSNMRFQACRPVIDFSCSRRSASSGQLMRAEGTHGIEPGPIALQRLMLQLLGEGRVLDLVELQREEQRLDRDRLRRSEIFCWKRANSGSVMLPA